jgi:maleylacetate reductase
MGAPRSLAELGMAERDIPQIAEEVISVSYGNPRSVAKADVEALLHAAWAGEQPTPGAPFDTVSTG